MSNVFFILNALIFKDQSKKFKVGIRFADEFLKYFAFSFKQKMGPESHFLTYFELFALNFALCLAAQKRTKLSPPLSHSPHPAPPSCTSHLL
jgi:hypothetical protein